MIKNGESKNLVQKEKSRRNEMEPGSESGEGSSSKSDREEFYGETPWFLGIGPWTPEVSEDELPAPLSFLESIAMVITLEDAVDELNILKYVIGAPVLDPMDPSYRSLSARYSRKITPSRLFPQAEVKPPLTSAIKLQRDREHIELIFNRTSKCLAEESTYTPLIWALEELQQEEEQDENLVQELKQNVIYLQELRKKVDEKKRLDDLEERDRDELMYRLQDDMDDVRLECEIEINFVNKWEMVRSAQNQWKLRNIENFYKDNTSKLLTKMKLERRVSHDMQLFLKLCQAELEEKLEEWMSLYDSEMERKENKIINLKYQRDQAEERKEKLHKLYAERIEELRAWITFRDDRRRKASASLVLQSWWRGVMVRKKLGPYKQKKHKNKKQ